MGCDIHVYTERFDDDNRAWVFVPGDGRYCEADEPKDWYVGRNYMLFGALAGVRVDMFVPCAEGRGLPKSLSPEVKKAYEAWRGDAHSTTWTTVAELRAYNWDQRDGNTQLWPGDRERGDSECVLIALAGHLLRHHCKDFFSVLDQIDALGHPADKVRLVLWFDN